jgi:hypothetical protein
MAENLVIAVSWEVGWQLSWGCGLGNLFPFQMPLHRLFGLPHSMMPGDCKIKYPKGIREKNQAEVQDIFMT